MSEVGYESLDSLQNLGSMSIIMLMIMIKAVVISLKYFYHISCYYV
jgi:hypothetical protein